ncbi:MAG: hypothetical protein ACLFRU_02055 [Paracoccaceae bacterium]
MPLADPPLKQAPLYGSMGRILEHGHDPEQSPFQTLSECHGPAALWALLALETLPRDLSLDGASLQRAFALLPAHLKSHLGPLLADRLLAAGHDQLAGDLLRGTTRMPSTAGSTQALSSARLDLAQGRPEAAEPVLSDAVDAGGETSPEALIALIDMLTESGRPVEAQLADLAAAFAREYRGTPVGSELRRAHVAALSGSGQHEAAMAALQGLRDMAGTGQEAAAVAPLVLGALAREASDIAFLKHALGAAMAWSGNLPETAGNAMASRLLELGFADAAARYLRNRDERPSGRERRLLRAEAALARGRATEAELELVGLEGRGVQRLLAQARTLKGDHRSALRLFAELEDQGSAERAAWLAEDWSTLRAGGDPALAGAAALADVTGGPPETSGSPTLARSRALLDESAGARDTLNALLSRMAIDPAGLATP